MNFAKLPRWAIPLAGESRTSWLAATGRLQPIEPRDWKAWVQAAVDEPERPLRGSTTWIGLPAELGDIRTIAPAWRLSPLQRNVFCPSCTSTRTGRDVGRYGYRGSMRGGCVATCTVLGCAIASRATLRRITRAMTNWSCSWSGSRTGWRTVRGGSSRCGAAIW